MTADNAMDASSPRHRSGQEEWWPVLRRHGNRLTVPRQLVMTAVCVLGPARPEQVYTYLLATARSGDALVNLSTVYRTLQVLEDFGLVRHTHLDHGAPAYEPVTEHTGLNLICQACQSVRQVDSAVAAKLVARLHADFGFHADLEHFAIEGRCRTCSGA